jgi:hypothetical protein
MLPPVPAEALIAKVLRVKAAATDFAADMVTEQEPVPVHAPDQPEKVELASGVAVRVTTVPALYGSEQSEPQLIPAGDEVMVPVPVPAALVTVRVYC